MRILSWVCACLRRWIIVRLARSAPRPTGQIQTPIVKGLSDTAGQKPESYKRSSRWSRSDACRPEEIAKAAVFLSSEDASFVAGAELFVDGGLTQV